MRLARLAIYNKSGFSLISISKACAMLYLWLFIIFNYKYVYSKYIFVYYIISHVDLCGYKMTGLKNYVL